MFDDEYVVRWYLIGNLFNDRDILRDNIPHAC